MIGAIIRSYHLTKYLRAVLSSLSHVDKVLVYNCRFKGVQATTDDTEAICAKFDNVEVIKCDDVDQWEPFNFGLRKLKGYDAVWICDTDELIDNSTRIKLEQTFIKSGKDALMLPLIDYASFSSKYTDRTHKPVVMVKSNIRAWDTRCFNYGDGLILNDRIHHFGLFGDLKWKKDNAWHSRARAEIEKEMSRDVEFYKMPDDIRRLLDENL